MGDLVRHPVFATRPVAEVVRGHVDRIHFDLRNPVLFAGDTKRLRRDEKIAA